MNPEPTEQKTDLPPTRIRPSFSAHTNKKQKKSKRIPLVLGKAPKSPGGWAPRISRQPSREGGKVVGPSYRPPLPLVKVSGTHFC